MRVPVSSRPFVTDNRRTLLPIVIASTVSELLFKDPMKTYVCIVCGFVYDEAAGCSDGGIAPGTRWADVPNSWLCPDCGVKKSDFELVEI